ncbi:hypothetical protein ACFLRN_02255 [Thermoproteota archaeon]
MGCFTSPCILVHNCVDSSPGLDIVVDSSLVLVVDMVVVRLTEFEVVQLYLDLEYVLVDVDGIVDCILHNILPIHHNSLYQAYRDRKDIGLKLILIEVQTLFNKQ